MNKIYVILHIPTGVEYDFTPALWADTDTRQQQSGAIIWRFLREKAAPEPAKVAAPTTATPAPLAKKGGCNCNKRK
jgi:hypothetical protein